MSSEKGLWRTVRSALRPYGRLQRVESRETGAGIPDVYCRIRGEASWLELKEVARWPRDPASPLVIGNLTLAQVRWLEEERSAGGDAYLLARVGRTFLLLDAPTARLVFERRLTRARVLDRALVHADGRFPTLPVVWHLTRRTREARRASDREKTCLQPELESV